MSTQPTVREMQNAILTIHKFADQDDYTLCRPYLKRLAKECANVLDVILSAREWKPIDEEGNEF